MWPQRYRYPNIYLNVRAKKINNQVKPWQEIWESVEVRCQIKPMEEEWKPYNIDWLWFLLVLIFLFQLWQPCHAVLTQLSFPLNQALCCRLHFIPGPFFSFWIPLPSYTLAVSSLYFCRCSSSSLKSFRDHKLVWRILPPKGLKKENVQSHSQHSIWFTDVSGKSRFKRVARKKYSFMTQCNSPETNKKTLFQWLLTRTERKRAHCDSTLPSACFSRHQP